MGNGRIWVGLGIEIYCCVALMYLWPYLTEVWAAYRENRPVRQVPRPQMIEILLGALAFAGGALWSWLNLGG